MAGARPKQSPLTEGNDLSKTEATRKVIETMIDGLNDHSREDAGSCFAETFRWMGNVGCGTKNGLKQYAANWQTPFRAVFSDRVFVDEVRIAEGEWMSAFGYCKAIHAREFMGIPATGKEVIIRYTDFWKVQDGRIVDNWVTVDFPYVMQQLGVDAFDGHGWEAFDRGDETPPISEEDAA